MGGDNKRIKSYKPENFLRFLLMENAMNRSIVDSINLINYSCSGLKAVGWHVGIHSYEWSPPTDAYETESSFIVRLEIAGMRYENFSIEYDNNFLIIRGIRSEFPERRAYHQMEIRYGEFSSAIEIPLNVDSKKANAKYQDGFLTIIIPKVKPTKIDIQDSNL
jgi:HSP20 family molecular chaperone IbpA